MIIHHNGLHAVSAVAPGSKPEPSPTLVPTKFDSKAPLAQTTTATTDSGLNGPLAVQHAAEAYNNEDDNTAAATMTLFKRDHATITPADGVPGLPGPTVPSLAVVATSSDNASTLALAKSNLIPNSATLTHVLTTVLGPTGVPARPVVVWEQCPE